MFVKCWITSPLTLPPILPLLLLILLPRTSIGQWEGREAIFEELKNTFGEPPGMVRLDPVNRVWANKNSQRVVVDGYIALRAGQLEMLACLFGTKEHESIVSVFSNAQTVHAGLLAVGAEQGEPVKWEPSYQPPTGSEIQVFALWKDENGEKQTIDATKWVRKIGTDDDTLDTNFVFAGSLFWEDPDTGEKKYMAESGDLICVSNFSTATLDVPMKSSQVNSGLMFAAFTERIPPPGTPVRLVLQVVDDKSSTNTDDGESEKKAAGDGPGVDGNETNAEPDSLPLPAGEAAAGELDDLLGLLRS